MYKKGSMSKTRSGRKDFRTHKRDKVFNARGHYQTKKMKPYMKGGIKKGSMSKTRSGRKDFRTHKGDKKFNARGHYQTKKMKPYMKGGYSNPYSLGSYYTNTDNTVGYAKKY